MIVAIPLRDIMQEELRLLSKVSEHGRDVLMKGLNVTAKSLVTIGLETAMYQLLHRNGRDR